MAASELSKNDLVTVRGALLPAAIKWYDIGLELLIPPDTLDTIQSDKNDKSSLCLREMLKICLDKKPTWKMLIDALRTPAVNDQSLADDLTQKYLSVESQDPPVETTEPPHKKRRQEDIQTIRMRSADHEGEIILYSFLETSPKLKFLCCKLCQSLPADPCRVDSQALSVFCKSCASRKFMTNNIHPDTQCKEQIAQLHLICPNSALGCEWEGKLGQLEIHRDECYKETVQCTYGDIGCEATMHRDEMEKHNDECRQKHLDYAMETITTMKGTDVDIRQRMKTLETTVYKKLEDQKQMHELAIQELKDSISQYPPVVVTMTDFHTRSDRLSVFEVVNRTETYISSSFYSHPQGYKLCIVLKCFGKSSIMKLKVAALHQPHDGLHTWPYRGIAKVIIQPGNEQPIEVNIEFDITSPPPNTGIEHVISENGFVDCNVPPEWRNLARQIPTPLITLKIECII